MIHHDRIDRLAALRVRFWARFQRDAHLTVIDRHRVARLRLAIAVELDEERDRRTQERRTPPRPTRVLRWMVPLNLPIRVRRPPP